MQVLINGSVYRPAIGPTDAYSQFDVIYCRFIYGGYGVGFVQRRDEIGLGLGLGLNVGWYGADSGPIRRCIN